MHRHSPVTNYIRLLKLKHTTLKIWKVSQQHNKDHCWRPLVRETSYTRRPRRYRPSVIGYNFCVTRHNETSLSYRLLLDGESCASDSFIVVLTIRVQLSSLTCWRKLVTFVIYFFFFYNVLSVLAVMIKRLMLSCDC